MIIKKKLVKRKIAGDVILVPISDSSLELKGLIVLNETAEFLWDRLPEAADKNDLVKALTDEYEVDRLSAEKAVDGLLTKLSEYGIM